MTTEPKPKRPMSEPRVPPRDPETNPFPRLLRPAPKEQPERPITALDFQNATLLSAEKDLRAWEVRYKELEDIVVLVRAAREKLADKRRKLGQPAAEVPDYIKNRSAIQRRQTMSHLSSMVPGLKEKPGGS
jgi:hypothetical protein